MSDIKALVRRVRSAGSAVAKEGSRLQAKGETLEADALAESVQELMAATETLELWRLRQAEELRRIALAVATQRAQLDTWARHDGPEMRARERVAFNKAANITSGTAETLGEIAQQLDPRDLEENDHA
jgi:hypothetical protein